MSIEVWLPYPKAPQYEVSTCGRVRREGRVTKGSKGPGGYMVTSITKAKKMRVHRLVALVHVPNPSPGIKPIVNHINGVRDDNRAVNLEWVTPAENSQKAAAMHGIKAKRAPRDDSPLPDEEWRKIWTKTGDTIEVSSLGRVRRRTTITYGCLNDGYKYVSNNLAVHRLVASAFIPNPEDKPLVNHIDGNRSNNVVPNLEWVTHSENSVHARDTGLRSKKGGGGRPVERIDRQGNVTLYPSIASASKDTGCPCSNISAVCSSKKKSAGGYAWKYAKIPSVADQQESPVGQNAVFSILNDDPLWQELGL